MQQKVTKQIVVRQKNAKPPTTVVTTTTNAPTKGKRNRRRQRRRQGRTTLPPYIQTLLDPDGVRGVAIPDGISMPTGTYAYANEYSLQTDASGNMIVAFNPKMFIGNAGAATLTGGAGIIVGNTTAGFGTAANPLTGVSNPDASTNVERFRVVSAELQLYSTLAPINVSGRVVSALLPSDYDMGNAVSAVSAPFLINLPNAKVTHLIEGGRAVYLPGGPDDYLYAPCTNDYAVVHTFATVNGSFHSTNNAATAQCTAPSGPTLLIAVLGGPASSIVNVRVVANIQFMAESTNSFVSLKPVQPDPVAISMAQQVISSGARSLQGFLETHEEQINSIGSALLGNIASAAGRSLAALAVNTLPGNLLPSLPGNVGSGRLRIRGM